MSKQTDWRYNVETGLECVSQGQRTYQRPWVPSPAPPQPGKIKYMAKWWQYLDLEGK